MGLLEPESGVLLARRAVQAVVAEAILEGVEYSEDASFARDRAGSVVYACGPWLPEIFPELLGGRIRVTRQEVFFFGTPNRSFAPNWIDISLRAYCPSKSCMPAKSSPWTIKRWTRCVISAIHPYTAVFDWCATAMLTDSSPPAIPAQPWPPQR